MKNQFTGITSIPPSLQKKYLPSLDGLRCFSIINVIISHVNESNPGMHNKYLSKLFGGIFGVHYFFVISGFIITTLLLTEKVRTGNISLKHFYLRRVLRILPLAYFFLLVLMILNYYFNLGVGTPEFLKAFFFSRNIGNEGSWYAAHYWSLSVEEQYYLIFPFILSRAGIKTYINLCLVIIVLFFAKNIYFHYSTANGEALRTVLDVVLSSSIISILIGSLTSILLFRYDTLLPMMNKYVLTLVLILLFLSSYFAFRNPKFFGLSSLISSCSIGASIFLMIRFPFGIIHNILNNKFIAYVGKLSFSLYIWQQLFTAHQPWARCFKYGDSIILNLVFLGIVSYLSYNYLEKPFLKLKQKFK